MPNTKTYLIRTAELTAMWWGGNVIAARDNQTGVAVNLWFAYVVTKEQEDE